MSAPKQKEEVDKYHGQGGSYLVDPATGERVLIERTEEAVPPSDGGAAPGESASTANQE